MRCLAQIWELGQDPIRVKVKSEYNTDRPRFNPFTAVNNNEWPIAAYLGISSNIEVHL